MESRSMVGEPISLRIPRLCSRASGPEGRATLTIEVGKASRARCPLRQPRTPVLVISGPPFTLSTPCRVLRPPHQPLAALTTAASLVPVHVRLEVVPDDPRVAR